MITLGSMYEEWKLIKDNYYVSNLGRFRRKLKNGYRYLKPTKKHNLYIIKIHGKDFNCARLVANYFIRPIKKEEFVYHKNHLNFDNYYRNLEILDGTTLGKKTGHIARSRRIVEVKNDEIVRSWRSSRKCAEDLFVSRQTVNDYCNKKVKKPMYNIMWEDDYFNEMLEPFSWEHKKR